MKKFFALAIFALAVVSSAFVQKTFSDEVDTSAIRKIWIEGTEHSEAMEMLQYLTDVCGPRRFCRLGER